MESAAIYRKPKIMFEKVVEKFGYDKMLHFAFGGEICAGLTMILFALFALCCPPAGALIVSYILSMVAVYGISYYKEEKIDKEFSWPDINAALTGCLAFGAVILAAALLMLLW